MDPVPRTTEAVLDRHPSPAVPMDELRSLLEAEERPGFAVPGDDRLLRDLRSRASVRVLDRPRRRWASRLGPRAWILAGNRERGGDHPRASVRGRMRSAIRALGGAVEPGSAQSWARWTRILEEERRVRSALLSRKRRIRRRREARRPDM